MKLPALPSAKGGDAAVVTGTFNERPQSDCGGLVVGLDEEGPIDLRSMAGFTSRDQVDFAPGGPRAKPPANNVPPRHVAPRLPARRTSS